MAIQGAIRNRARNTLTLINAWLRIAALRTDDSDPCAWTFAYKSVIGYGTVRELTTPDEKAHGLNQIMRHYSGRDWDFDEDQTATTRVWRIDIETLTGKRSFEKPAS